MELLNNFPWKAALQNYFDETVRTSLSVMVYIAHPCVRTDSQIRPVWCLVGIRRHGYEATIETKAREQQLQLMGAMKVLIANVDFAIQCQSGKMRFALCNSWYTRFVCSSLCVIQVLEECITAIRMRATKREENLLKALLGPFRTCHGDSHRRS